MSDDGAASVFRHSDVDLQAANRRYQSRYLDKGGTAHAGRRYFFSASLQNAFAQLLWISVDTPHYGDRCEIWCLWHSVMIGTGNVATSQDGTARCGDSVTPKSLPKEVCPSEKETQHRRVRRRFPLQSSPSAPGQRAPEQSVTRAKGQLQRHSGDRIWVKSTL